jgi:hypothetical protein
MKYSTRSLWSLSFLVVLVPVLGLALNVTVVNTGDGGAGSLRQAITDVNGSGDLSSTIDFNIGGSPPFILALASTLPTVIESVFIDGFSQPGYSTGVPAVVLDGAGIGGSWHGLQLSAPDSTVRGLDLRNWGGDGIRVSGSNCVVVGCHVTGSGNSGVLINAGLGSTIGGTTVAERNVLSGNGYAGVEINGAITSGNRVLGNYIGVDSTGLTIYSNTYYGVFIASSPSNTIGGATPAARNILSGNGNNGIVVFAPEATDNVVLGNYVGLDATGSVVIGQGESGFYINNAPRTTIGGMSAGAGNVISGSGHHGIQITGTHSTGTRVTGNFIGTDASGLIPLSNGWHGVSIYQTSSNIIGGAGPFARNVICANGYSGVGINGITAVGNVVQGNWVGVAADGVTPLPNGWSGISLGAVTTFSPDTSIGGTAAGDGNIIAGNQLYGVYISGTNATGNLVMGNRIGIAADGVTGVGNGHHGIYIYQAVSNTVGGTVAGAGNFIAYNTADGVSIAHSNAFGNAILGNSIYSNGWLGIDLDNNHVVETNDALDVDTGPNGLQNYPLLSCATCGSTVIDGQLSSTPSTAYRVEFFSCRTGDPSTHGEGDSFLGWADILTDPTGEAVFSVTLQVSVAKGHTVTATATDPDGNTSEFSKEVEIGFIDLDSDQIEDGWEGDHGLSAAMPNLGDSDSDGYSDLQEFRADTHPNDSNDFLRVSAISNSVCASIHFLSSSARLYRLTVASELDDPTVWHFIGPQLPGNGGGISLDAPPGGEKGFSRVEAFLP